MFARTQRAPAPGPLAGGPWEVSRFRECLFHRRADDVGHSSRALDRHIITRDEGRRTPIVPAIRRATELAQLDAVDL